MRHKRRNHLLGLGCPASRRVGHTPVFSLDAVSMKLNRLETTGAMSGWISGHKAVLKSGSKIIVQGGDIWVEIDGKNDLVENNHRMPERALVPESGACPGPDRNLAARVQRGTTEEGARRADARRLRQAADRKVSYSSSGL